MSSSSFTSIYSGRRRYEVFLSFRGRDTRQNFVSHLFAALELNGIKTFNDEGIRRGLDIDRALFKQIEESQIALIVFSKNYSDSPWCLNELVQIMDCYQRKRLIVYPVFYDVNPSDVRNLTGEFGKAFLKHQDANEVDLWRKTLGKTAVLAGWDLTNPVSSHEASCITKIMETVICDLDYLSNCIDKSLIGLDHRMRNIMSLTLGEHGVGFIGILGMSGSCNTTIARAMFDDMCEQFDGRCFVYNISEVSKNHGLIFLQKHILSSVLGDKKVHVSDKYDGYKKMKLWLRRRKVLIVLDKVDSVEQLEALAGARSWFGDGTRIIITTTDEHLLAGHKLVNNSHSVILLNDEEPIQLLNSCAFQNDTPTKTHKDSLDSVTRYAAGNPCALKCLGAKLINTPIDEWEDTIDILATCPETKINNMLKLNLEGLNTYQKGLFLDIACFFNGWVKDEVIGILEQNKGTECIKAIVMSNLNKLDARAAFDAFTNMKKLRLLHANTQRRIFLVHGSTCVSVQWIMEGSSCLKCLPSDLKWLTWDYFSLESWPKNFHAEKLVGLQMRYSCIRDLCIGKNMKVLAQLKILDLSFSKDLIETPDFGCLPYLEKLILEFCSSLVKVHSSIGDHNKLLHMNLRSCEKLKSLPLSLKISTLEVLNLSSCSKLTKIPEFVGMTNLSELDLSHNTIEELPLSIGDLPGLTYLDISNCRNLTSIPQSIWTLNNRAEIILYGCPFSKDCLVKPQE